MAPLHSRISTSCIARRCLCFSPVFFGVRSTHYYPISSFGRTLSVVFLLLREFLVSSLWRMGGGVCRFVACVSSHKHRFVVVVVVVVSLSLSFFVVFLFFLSLLFAQMFKSGSHNLFFVQYGRRRGKRSCIAKQPGGLCETLFFCRKCWKKRKMQSRDDLNGCCKCAST
jgi:hypothetical protein